MTNYLANLLKLGKKETKHKKDYSYTREEYEKAISVLKSVAEDWQTVEEDKYENLEYIYDTLQEFIKDNKTVKRRYENEHGLKPHIFDGLEFFDGSYESALRKDPTIKRYWVPII